MNTTTTTIKPVVKIETGLRAFMANHAGSRDWRVVLRIDWETGRIDVRRHHNSEGSSMRTYKRFQSEWVLSSKMTNREIRVLVDDLAFEIQTVLSGWSRDLDTQHGNIVGKFTSEAQDARRKIADYIEIENEYCDLGIIRLGRGGRA
jgi:hypothetical protein